MAVSKGDILESLRKVIDPEIGINIVDLGLIYRIDVLDDRTEVDFTLTSPGCPLADSIEADIRNILADDHKIENVQTQVVWNPPWSLDFMSEEARLELGYPI
jgi:metal-sulfur cluster biosynthetic enzyme